MRAMSHCLRSWWHLSLGNDAVIGESKYDMISYCKKGDRMSSIGLHPRNAGRHPGITDEDVVAAMRSMIRYKQRSSGEWLAVGLNGSSRIVELVCQYDEGEDFFFVFHGMMPSPGKTLRELGLERRA